MLWGCVCGRVFIKTFELGSAGSNHSKGLEVDMDWAHCILKQGQLEDFKSTVGDLARKPLVLPLSNA